MNFENFENQQSESTPPKNVEVNADSAEKNPWEYRPDEEFDSRKRALEALNNGSFEKFNESLTNPDQMLEGASEVRSVIQNYVEEVCGFPSDTEINFKVDFRSKGSGDEKHTNAGDTNVWKGEIFIKVFNESGETVSTHPIGDYGLAPFKIFPIDKGLFEVAIHSILKNSEERAKS